MFVKINLESPGSLKAPPIFKMDDTATIFDLKRCIEQYVNIPAESQEIFTLSRTMGNQDTLDTIVKQLKEFEKNLYVAAISLYSLDKFVGFLEFDTKNEGDEQCNFLNQPLNEKGPPIDNMPRNGGVSSDSVQACQSMATESSDRSNTTSGNRKRKLITCCDTSSKRICLRSESVESNARPTLESLAECVQEIPQTESIRKQMINCVNSPRSVHLMSSTEPIVKMAAQVPLTVLNRKLPMLTSSQSRPVSESPVSKPAPYDTIRPEQRRYAIVISNDNSDIGQSDFNRILAHYFDLFQTSHSCKDLDFSDQTPVSLFDGKLWVMCENRNTCEWIAKGVRTLTPYKCSSFISFYELIKCSMTLPRDVENKDLTNVFNLLELQNCGMTTTKWCVMERKVLEGKTGDKICEHELLTLYLDQASKQYIQKQNFKIKYGFWKIKFEF